MWANQDQFHLDDSGGLIVQSGCPPDYFSATGQLWRNPLYRWDVMAADGYSWWLARLRRCLELTDLVRIDHFRALSRYWEIDGKAEDAMGGRWVDGPGQHFLDAVRAEFPGFPFVAEDLGVLDDEVYALRDDNALPGMRIIQFGFDGTPDNPHLPERYPESCVVYTGTHDNAPIAAWWASLDARQRAEVAGYYRHEPDAGNGRATWSFIEAAIGSRAVAAVVPMQDWLVLDSRHRMNDPAVEQGNWGWRMPAGALSDDLARSMRSLTPSATRRFRLTPSSAAGASTVSRSAPMVVESPWPVCTIVSSGSSEQLGDDRAQDRRLVAVAAAGRAGAAAEQRVAGEHHAGVRRRGSSSSRGSGRACAVGTSSWPATADRRRPARRRRRATRRATRRPTSIRSSGWSRIGASTASRSGTAALMWSLWPWVSTIARTLRPSMPSTIGA